MALAYMRDEFLETLNTTTLTLDRAYGEGLRGNKSSRSVLSGTQECWGWEGARLNPVAGVNGCFAVEHRGITAHKEGERWLTAPLRFFLYAP